MMMNDNLKLYTVEIRGFTDPNNFENINIIVSFGPMTKRKAEKVEAGININLDHERFYTHIREI